MPQMKNFLVSGLVFVALTLATAEPTQSQDSRSPLGSLGPPISDLDMTNRMKDTELRDTEALATLELTYWNTGDLKSILVKKNPQNLFVTLELDGAQLKDIARNKKPKVKEAVKPGRLTAKGRWSRPGKRLETICEGQLQIGFQQVIFFPYGGEDGYFGCHVLPMLLPDEEFTAWKEALPSQQSEAYYQCAGVHPRGSGDFWNCIEESDIPLPRS